MKPEEGLRTIDDLESRGGKIFVRMDINLPLDPRSWEVLDDTRIVKSLPTLEELVDCALVIGSHQSRPLKSDFSSMSQHAEIIGRELDKEVQYVPDIIGPAALRSIRELEPGQILMLDNLRLCSEENHNASPSALLNTHLVRRLSPLFDHYVNDAFAASHRSQPSLVGLPQVIEPYAGRLMTDEIGSISHMLDRMDAPRTLCLGGAKLETKLGLLRVMLDNQNVDKVLVSGLAGIAFMAAAGYKVGAANADTVRSCLPLAESILEKHEDRLVLPVDVAVDEDGDRVECDLEGVANRVILDVGSRTTRLFAEHLKESRSIFANGPAGFFEMERFRKGTDSLLLAIAMSPAPVKVLGGGHLGSLAGELGMSDGVHISTGGGIILALLGGEKLPAIEILRGNWQRRELDTPGF